MRVKLLFAKHNFSHHARPITRNIKYHLPNCRENSFVTVLLDPTRRVKLFYHSIRNFYPSEQIWACTMKFQETNRNKLIITWVLRWKMAVCISKKSKQTSQSQWVIVTEKYFFHGISVIEGLAFWVVFHEKARQLGFSEILSSCFGVYRLKAFQFDRLDNHRQITVFFRNFRAKLKFLKRWKILSP